MSRLGVSQRVLSVLSGLVLLIMCATNVEAQTINNHWFRWSTANNGSLIVGYTMQCGYDHTLTSEKTYSAYQYLGQWTWGRLNGTEERYAVTNAQPGVQHDGRSEYLIGIHCRDKTDTPRIFEIYKVTVRKTNNPSKPDVSATLWRAGDGTN